MVRLQSVNSKFGANVGIEAAPMGAAAKYGLWFLPSALQIRGQSNIGSRPYNRLIRKSKLLWLRWYTH